MDSGEMSFRLFDFSPAIEELVSRELGSAEKLDSLQAIVGEPALPNYLLEYIRRFSPNGERSLAVHPTGSIAGYGDADQEAIVRRRGLIGKSDREEKKYPQAVHHIKVFRNEAGKARVFYRYHGSIKFLRMRAAD